MRTVLAPGKVNLVLEVGPRRADGYHELATVFQTIELYDRITVAAAGAGVDIELEVTGADLPSGSGNLVWQAASLLAAAMGRQRAGVRIHLEKRLPVAAGLGGGSADAAATLQALAELWDVAQNDLLRRIAYQLGADVPFFLQGGAALGQDRGESLTPLVLPQLWFVLANPGFSCSTGAVYDRLDQNRLAQNAGCPDDLGERCRRFVEALHHGRETVGPLLYNDLARPACELVPAIAPLLADMRQAGALGATVSGSGATVFGLAAGPEHAAEIAARLQSGATWVWWGSSGENKGGGEWSCPDDCRR